MRHLHAWNDPRGITPVGQEACADDGRNPRRTLGQSVPLHRVHADFRSGGRCGTPPDNKMRSDPQDYQLIAPGTLHAVVSLLAKEPGAWLPIAGGTDVMVLYAAGKLPARKLSTFGIFRSCDVSRFFQMKFELAQAVRIPNSVNKKS